MKLRYAFIQLFERLAGSPKVAKEAGTFAAIEYAVQRRRIFDELGIDLVIDVGGNIGQFVKGLRGFYAGEVISFEPVSAAFDKLSAVAASDPRWKVVQVALGRRSETRAIHVSKRTAFSSFLRPNNYCEERFPGLSTTTHEESVQVRTLEDALAEHVHDLAKRRVFLKLDTQGYDLEVFAGLGTAGASVLAMQSEVSVIPIYESLPHWTETVAAYERAGFGVAGLFPVNYDGARVIEFDCLMVRG